jgi:nanoRNase/pAp phosphatase (c-di-AMP/oligoRNAs hydrolase)
MNSPQEKLKRFYSQFSGDDRVLIVINADPDAMASAMAIKRLLWRKTASITISNINIIQRPDNLSMARLLGIEMVFFDEIDLKQFDRFVMVDSQPDHNEYLQKISPHVIIDHHPPKPTKAPFVDIRPRYGATASIMTEYLKTAKIKPSAKLATGLFYAIKTDTSDFERQTLMEDLRAFQFLFRHANVALARRIEQAELKYNFLIYFKRALENQQLRKGRIFAHIGPVSNPDVCVLVADFFMHVESVNWSIVSGRCDDKLIVILRNDGIRKNAGKVAKESFGSLGSAGGHKTAARAEVSLAEIKAKNLSKNDKRLASWIIQQIEKKAGTPAS